MTNGTVPKLGHSRKPTCEASFRAAERFRPEQICGTKVNLFIKLRDSLRLAMTLVRGAVGEKQPFLTIKNLIFTHHFYETKVTFFTLYDIPVAAQDATSCCKEDVGYAPAKAMSYFSLFIYAFFGFNQYYPRNIF